MEKQCPGCDRITNEFAKNSKRKDGLQVYCKRCKKIRDAEYYQNNREAQARRVAAHIEKLKAYVSDYKQQRGCRYCPECDPIVLDFHHKDDNKEAGISQLVFSGKSRKLMTEIVKCEVACSNCHRKLHAGRKLCPVSCNGVASGS